MRRRVVVTGLGCVSPVGNTVAESWANLLEGRSGIATVTSFDASKLAVHFAGEVKGFNVADYMPEKEARRVPELYARLAAQGTPTELYAFPDEAHIKVQPRHRMAAYERNLDWFRFWLQDYRDPDAKKADQYGRWDILRSRWKARPVLH